MAIGPEEARLALQAPVRRDELEPAARVRLFAELADHFKNVVAFPPETIEAMPGEQYVRNVVDCLFRSAGGAPASVAERGSATRGTQLACETVRR